MTRNEVDTLEDLDWLDKDGRVGLTEAAKRTEFPSSKALDMWLRSRGHVDLLARLRSREPIGMSREEFAPPAAPMSKQHDVLAAGLAHGSAKVRRKAERAQAILDELAALIEEHSEAEKIRSEVEKLEAKLAEAKQRLRAARSGGEPVDAAFPCEHCDKSFTSKHGLGVHAGRAHGEAA